MVLLLCSWLALLAAPAPAADPLWLAVRVFDGGDEVTDAARVTVHTTGTRVEGRRLPLAPNGERQMTLPAGRYDVQLLHLDEGRVLGVRWTGLRLLADYPGAHGRQLEVFNMQRGYGAIQVRQAGTAAELGTVRWTAALQPTGGGGPTSTAFPGDGYVLFVARPGTYDIAIRTPDNEQRWVRGVQVVEDLTYLHTWR